MCLSVCVTSVVSVLCVVYECYECVCVCMIASVAREHGSQMPLSTELQKCEVGELDSGFS